MIWCCDFVQTYDLLFRPLFLFFLMNQGSRKVVHIAATRNPTQQWTAQQLRNATMDGLAPRFLIRDRDEKFGATFDRVAKGVGTQVIKTAVRAPNMNPIMEDCQGHLPGVDAELSPGKVLSPTLLSMLPDLRGGYENSPGGSICED
jgi:hypothetical protein